MLRTIGPGEIITLLALVLIVVPYLLALQRVLKNIAPESRTLSPGKVWLMLVPIFNLLWHFVLVINISKSLQNEFARRNNPGLKPGTGKLVGLAMCIFATIIGGALATIVLFSRSLAAGVINTLFGVYLICFWPAVVCWIVYWVKVSGYSRLLKRTKYALSHP